MASLLSFEITSNYVKKRFAGHIASVLLSDTALQRLNFANCVAKNLLTIFNIPTM